MKRTLSIPLCHVDVCAAVGRGGNGDKEPVTTDKPAESQNTDTTTTRNSLHKKETCRTAYITLKASLPKTPAGRNLLPLRSKAARSSAPTGTDFIRTAAWTKDIFRKGFYGMKEKAALKRNGMSRRTKMEEYLVAQQSVEGLTLNDEGRTDAVSGVSIHVNGFTQLAKALAAGPVEAGPYKDGAITQKGLILTLSPAGRKPSTLPLLTARSPLSAGTASIKTAVPIKLPVPNPVNTA